MPASAPISYAASIALSGASSAHSPEIAMSAHVMKGDLTTLLSKGMDGFLGKPASNEQLLACLNEWLGAAALKPRKTKQRLNRMLSTSMTKFSKKPRWCNAAKIPTSECFPN